MRYLLDTNVLIDLSHGVAGIGTTVRGWITALDEVAICAVQVTEYLSGIPPDRREAQQRFLRAFVSWDIGLRAAVLAGTYRYDFARRGKQLSLSDAMIAAVAWEHSATLVTRNVRDFPMTDIRVITI